MMLTLDTAISLTQGLLALVLIQQSIEHVVGNPTHQPSERYLFLLRIALALLLLANVAPPWPLLGLAVVSLVVLLYFNGPYNGGSDRMGLLALWCMTLAQLVPSPAWREMIVGYLGIQIVLSYFIAGWVKLVNPAWRSGRALRDVFLFSAYPVSENLRRWADRPRVLRLMGWAVISFELAFPLVLLHPVALATGLVIAGSFHLANACLFGLNRFFWTWLAVYPSLIWLQGRIAI